MSAKEYVYAAIYSHEYGTDAQVFRNLEDAETRCDDIAFEYWNSCFPPEERPNTNQVLRDAAEAGISLLNA